MDKQKIFIDRLVDYKATVKQGIVDSGISSLVLRFLQEVEATSVVVPPGLDMAWLAETKGSGIQIRVDDPPLSKQELNEASAVVTAAKVAIAETGTIVLDHQADQGRRIISLLPDTHICIVRASQILTSVPEAMTHLASSIQERRPLTWISGPSATVDIELTRVEGVHGPRKLYVIIVD